MNKQQRNILHHKQIKVRWGDMDSLGHVNNTLYLRYLEEIRLDWFDSFDDVWSNDSMGPVVVSISINFRQPIVWPATVDVDLSALWSGGKSVLLNNEIRDHDSADRLYADAKVVCVWLDHVNGTTRSLPKTVIRALGALNGGK